MSNEPSNAEIGKPTLRREVVGAPLVDLSSLATRVKTAHGAVVKAGTECVAHAMAAGDALAKAKLALPFGEWLPWLKAHCDLSERTAQIYMKLAAGRSVLEQKSAAIADLTMGRALKLVSEKTTTKSEGGDFDVEALVDRMIKQVKRIDGADRARVVERLKKRLADVE